ncbi:MAG: hypothetical protein LJE92_07405 [Gammaproteobacteria bacterium]|jgi:hypothetical protein|nr:hypothetical protein [Gammaproteobacteria bacterium]
MFASSIFTKNTHPLCPGKNLWPFVTQSSRDFENIVAEGVTVPTTRTAYGIANVHSTCSQRA